MYLRLMWFRFAVQVAGRMLATILWAGALTVLTLVIMAPPSEEGMMVKLVVIFILSLAVAGTWVIRCLDDKQIAWNAGLMLAVVGAMWAIVTYAQTGSAGATTLFLFTGAAAGIGFAGLHTRATRTRPDRLSPELSHLP